MSKDEKDRVLSALINSTVALTALNLSRRLNLHKKNVNIHLYSLHRRGQAQLQEGYPPLWTATVAAIDDTHDASQQELLKVLEDKDHVERGISSFSIALTLQKSIAVVNSMLYLLQEDGMVERANISPPAWRRVVSAREASASSANHSDCSEDANSEEATKKRPATEIQEEIEHRSKKTRRITVEAEAVQYHPEDVATKDAKWASRCADAVWEKYRLLYPGGKNNDIISGFIIRESNSDSTSNNPRVVAIGSGTAIAAGDKYSLRGSVVHDCHAEIVARRSLLRWMYHQIGHCGKAHSLAQKCDDGSTEYVLKPFELWLYISQAPCGDAAVFSHSDGCPKSDKIGKLRLKREAGNGTEPIKERPERQTYDGLLQGDRALCHSCSDKLMRWNILGVQGGLLSRLIPPVYLKGVIIGDIFNAEHVSRAICCRSAKVLREQNAHIPSPFAIHHPTIIHTDRNIQPRHEKIKKRGNVSINWTENDSQVEQVDSRTGRVSDNGESRISKRAFFTLFSSHVVTSSTNALSYRENKEQAVTYQQAKANWETAIDQYGHWVHKPNEVDDFYLT